MTTHPTIGQTAAIAVKKVTTEIDTAQKLLKADLPLPGNVPFFNEVRNHLAEAIDGVLNFAGSFGGEGSKREVLEKILPRHNIHIDESITFTEDEMKMIDSYRKVDLAYRAMIDIAVQSALQLSKEQPKATVVDIGDFRKE